MSGLLIAAPSSGSGKTTVTLGLLRAFKRLGYSMIVGKAGPDYIDPAFHAHASGVACLNFDPWAMRSDVLRAQATATDDSEPLLVIEAMMGLFDGAADGRGSPADLAALLDLQILLVVDCARMSHSVAALVHGYATFRPDIRIAGLILNKVGSDRHEKMLRDALGPLAIPVVGVLRAEPDLILPERHLGLVQAGEHTGLDGFVDLAADRMAAGCDLDQMAVLARLSEGHATGRPNGIAPLGQHIAIAKDVAFAFCYQHLLNQWRSNGATLSFFSPLADEVPDPSADAVYLPGGYPELHAGVLAGNATFKTGMADARGKGTVIYGECGGYMVLGDALVDAAGQSHAMLGFLPLVTSFESRKRHLGYRHVQPLPRSIFKTSMTAHEFHYSTLVSEGSADRLFDAWDATGASLGAVGLQRGAVSGSYMHLIDRRDV